MCYAGYAGRLSTDVAVHDINLSPQGARGSLKSHDAVVLNFELFHLRF